MYDNEPFEGVTDPDQQALILGGQVRDRSMQKLRGKADRSPYGRTKRDQTDSCVGREGGGEYVYGLGVLVVVCPLVGHDAFALRAGQARCDAWRGGWQGALSPAD